MTEQRIAQIVLTKQHNHSNLVWGHASWDEVTTAMDSELWDYDAKTLLPIADGNVNTPEPPESPPVVEKPKRQTKRKQENKSVNTPDNKPKLKGITAFDLANMEIPEVKWFVDGLLPEGLTLLAGAAKVGKSFLAWNIALAVANGGIALSTIDINKPYNAVYMAMEDPLPLLQERLKLMCPDGVPNNVHIVNDFYGLKFDNDGIEMVGNYLDETQAEILIVDTWGHVKPNPQLNNGTSYDTDYASLIPVQRFAHDRNIAVVLVTHTTKGKHEDNPFDNIQGSTGMQAGCDTMLMLAHSQGSHVLQVRGRRILESEYAMTLNNGLWVMEGDADEFRMSDERKEILHCLRIASDAGMTVSELAEETDRTKPAISKMLKKMVLEGEILQPKVRGRYYYREIDNDGISL